MYFSITDKYLLQIQKDSENFNRGLRLLKNSSNSVCSQIEIEKAKSDRDFQNIIAVVSSITATVAILKEGKEEERKLIFGFLRISKVCSYPLFYSLIFALVIGFLCWRLRKRLL